MRIQLNLSPRQKRTDNGNRKREVTDNEARKQGTLACGSWAASEVSSRHVPTRGHVRIRLNLSPRQKRTDNGKGKREVTDKARKQGLLVGLEIQTSEEPGDKAREQGILAGVYSDTSEDSVESNPRIGRYEGPPSWFCTLSRDVLLVWEPKTPQNSQKNPPF